MNLLDQKPKGKETNTSSSCKTQYVYVFIVTNMVPPPKESEVWAFQCHHEPVLLDVRANSQLVISIITQTLGLFSLVPVGERIRFSLTSH